MPLGVKVLSKQGCKRGVFAERGNLCTQGHKILSEKS